MKILVVSLQPFNYATRTRKAALTLSKNHEVEFLSLAGIGRAGTWDKAGVRYENGVRIRQIFVPRTISEPSKINHLRNIVGVYFPGILKLLYAVFRTKSDWIVVTSVILSPLGFFHKYIYRSRLIVDVNEKPASAPSPDSLSSLAARIEPIILRLVVRYSDLITTVAPGHLKTLKESFSANNGILVRNAPLKEWISDTNNSVFRETLTAILVGSLFEGRALESLIDAIKIAVERGSNFNVHVYGRGRSSYIETLRQRAISSGVADRILFFDSIPPERVSETYQKGHLGLVLYDTRFEANDSLSNKILECVASGRPVLATNLEENAAFVAEYSVGLTCEGTPESIADGLIEFEKKNQHVQMEKHCKNLGKSLFYWEKEYSQVLRFIENN